jgi:hypothetical protein
MPHWLTVALDVFRGSSELAPSCGIFGSPKNSEVAKAGLQRRSPKARGLKVASIAERDIRCRFLMFCVKLVGFPGKRSGRSDRRSRGYIINERPAQALVNEWRSAAALTGMSNVVAQRSRDLSLIYPLRACWASVYEADSRIPICLPFDLGTVARDKVCVTNTLSTCHSQPFQPSFQGRVVVKFYACHAWLRSLGVNGSPTLVLATANTLLP